MEILAVCADNARLYKQINSKNDIFFIVDIYVIINKKNPKTYLITGRLIQNLFYEIMYFLEFLKLRSENKIESK